MSIRVVAAACALLIAYVCGTTPIAAGSGSSVHFAIGADPQSLDPLFAHPDAGGVEAELARLIFEPFVDIDASGHQIPVLLSRIPTVANGDLSPDGRTIVYHLRPGVRWHDGVAVDAHDVLFTLHAILDDRNPVRSREGYDRIVAADAIDAHTVRIHLRAAWAPAVASLFSYGTAPQYVLPAHLLEHEARLDQSAFGAHPVGNGPFRFVRWERGDHLEYEANPQYWRGAPKVDQLEVRIIPDPGANFTALLSGAIDWSVLSPAQWKSVAQRSDLHFHDVPLAMAVGLALNTRHAPLDDPRVRRAIAASLDRRAISEKLTFGRYPPMETSQRLQSWAHDANAMQPAYDPLAADRALDAAGWVRGADGIRVKAGHRLMLVYTFFPESQTGVRVATFVERALRARGIDVVLKSVSNAKLFLPAAQGGVLASGAFDLAYIPWPLGADPDDAALLTCVGALNYGRWCDAEVDRLEAQAQASPDRATRVRLYGQVQARTTRDVPIVFLFDPAYVYATRPGLTGFAPNAFSATWNAANWTIAAN